jgi:hypothetical protein
VDLSHSAVPPALFFADLVVFVLRKCRSSLNFLVIFDLVSLVDSVRAVWLLFKLTSPDCFTHHMGAVRLLFPHSWVDPLGVLLHPAIQIINFFIAD